MKLKNAVKSLYFCYTGFSKRPEGGSETLDALAAVFLPLIALAAGLAAVAAAWLARLCGLTLAPVAAGLAMLAVLGGLRKIKSVSTLLSVETKAAGTAIIITLVLLFETFAIYEITAYRDATMMYNSLLYLPVAGAVAMLSASCVMKEEEGAGSMLAAAKGGHMLLGCLLALVLMLPAYGLKSLAFVAVSVLAGPVMVLLLKKRSGGEAAYLAGIAGEILFVVLLALLRGPVVYY